MIRALYSVVMAAAQPLLRAKLRRRAEAEPLYAQHVEERFGHYTQAAETASELVWLHAVSLGETRAAAIVIQRLRQSQPGLRLLLTHGTATGRAEGAKLLRAGDVQVWQPWDAIGPVHRFLAHFKPRLGLLMETEIWPNLTAVCAQRRVPLVLANARLSAKSLRQTQRLAWLARPAYRRLAQVWAQTADDAERLTQVGARVTGVMGNVKFDAQPSADQLAEASRWRAAWRQNHNTDEPVDRHIVLFASSRDGEESQFIQFLEKIEGFDYQNQPQAASEKIAKQTKKQAQFLLVPRHPQRFDDVAALLEQRGYTVIRRSNWGSGGADGGAEGQAALPAPQPKTIWLGDSMGEMALYYGLADVALLGGSFEKLGGQNLIEAAACGCPVVMGPHTFNFAEAAERALAEGAARGVPDMGAALQAALDWLDDPVALELARQRALAFSRRHQGATQRLLDALQIDWGRPTMIFEDPAA